jgi:hypothetical protein
MISDAEERGDVLNAKSGFKDSNRAWQVQDSIFTRQRGER